MQRVVRWLKGSETHHFGDSMGYAEFIIEPAKRPDRWLNPFCAPGQAG